MEMALDAGPAQEPLERHRAGLASPYDLLPPFHNNYILISTFLEFNIYSKINIYLKIGQINFNYFFTFSSLEVQYMIISL